MVHTRRQWMVTHEWMLKSNRQTEWIERKGVLIWLALYSAGLGGGIFLISLFYNNLFGLALGWSIIVALKGSFHLADLGRPSRAWRMFFNLRRSWLSRGFLLVFLFAAVGLVQIGLTRYLPGSALEVGWKGLSGVLTLAVSGYSGAVLNRVKGIPAWNVPFLPIIFINCGILGGFGFNQAMAALSGPASLVIPEELTRWLLVGTAMILVAYLAIVTQRQAGENSAEICRLKGGLSRLILAWVLVLGALIPLIVGLESHRIVTGGAVFWILAAASELLSGMVVIFYILKSGAYSPLIVAQRRPSALAAVRPARVGGEEWANAK